MSTMMPLGYLGHYPNMHVGIANGGINNLKFFHQDQRVNGQCRLADNRIGAKEE
jgi:hypothetical protein